MSKLRLFNTREFQDAIRRLHAGAFEQLERELAERPFPGGRRELEEESEWQLCRFLELVNVQSVKLSTAIALLSEWRESDITECDDRWADFTDRVDAFLESVGDSQPVITLEACLNQMSYDGRAHLLSRLSEVKLITPEQYATLKARWIPERLLAQKPIPLKVECTCPRNNMYDSGRTGWREDCPEHGLNRPGQCVPVAYQGSPTPVLFTPRPGACVWATLDGKRVQAIIHEVHPGKGITLVMDDGAHVIFNEDSDLEPVAVRDINWSEK